LISWKYSFEKIGKDLELARKKKQALDDLFNSGRISQNTYDSIKNEITNAIAEIEARQKDLAEKMTSKITELEEQINTLEMFLANSELQYAAGEIDEQSHAKESGAFNLALEATKQQLNVIKEIVGEIIPEVVPKTSHEPIETVETPPPTEIVVEPKMETATETLSEKSLEPEPAIAETEKETSTEVPVETATETPVEETTAEEKVEAPPETSMETEPSVSEEIVEKTIEQTIVTPEATPEITVEETSKEEKIEVPVEEESFFRDQEDTAEEKRYEEKEERDE